MAPDPFDLLRDRLGDRVRHRGHDSYEALCPAHDDSTPSLSVSRGTDHPVAMYCHAGCTVDAIVAAVGLKPADLCTPNGNGNGHRRPREVAAYPYVDETSTPLFEVVRFDPKDFRQRRPDGQWGIGGVRRVLYRFPDVLAGVAAGRTIWIGEGEKDADALEGLDVVATTNPGGAGKWRAEYNPVLAGAEVVIVADRDEAGYRHARSVAGHLERVAASVRVVLPVPGAKDAAQHCGLGKGLDDFVDWDPATGDPGGPPLGQLLAEVEAERVTWLWHGWLPVGKVVVLDGDPDLGKSTLSLDLAARITTGSPMPDGSRLEPTPGNVVLLSAEDGLADTIRPRLEAAGADVTRVWALTEVNDRDADGNPRTRPPVIPTDLPVIEALVRQCNARLVIVDVLMAYLESQINAHKDQDIRGVLHHLMRLAERHQCIVMVLRHLNKSGGGKALYRGGGSIGIIGAARVGMVVAQDPDDENRRVLAVAKGNLAAKPAALSYRLVGDPVHDCGRIEWLGRSHHSADALMVGPPPADDETAPRAAAQVFLRDLLSEGPMPVQKVKAEVLAAGMVWRTVHRAKDDLGILTLKRGKPGDPEQWWDWVLPAPEGATGPVDANTPRGWQDRPSWHLRDDEPHEEREPQLPLSEEGDVDGSAE